MKTLPAIIVLLLLSVAPAGGEAQLPLHLIELPAGFQIQIYAANVPGARSMALAPDGTLFVGSRDPGRVYAVVEPARDGRPATVVSVAEGMNMPNGVAYKGGDLYVAEVSRIVRFPHILDRLQHPGPPEIVNDTFPGDRWHGWKFIRFGPDGMLYVPVGAPCNVCLKDDDRYAAIHRMRTDGSGLEIFARGVRNTVGFDWHPETGVMWFTDNGRDWFGDDRPPDELNRAPEPGRHFGFPFLHGTRDWDPVFEQHAGGRSFTRPAQELGPHVAALGMRFYTGDAFPKDYWHQIFIAEHGSWNRTTPIGYRISLVRVSDGRATTYETFASGWLQGGDAWGRPVDIEIIPDGSMLVSDDRAGAVYRIVYTGKTR